MASAAALTRLEPFHLGGVEIRPGTREILGPGGCEVIEPKVMQVLLELIAANGEIVSRDTLVSKCWDGRAVSEDAISRVIQRLRRLSESLDGGFVIRTVHKVGYRLLASDAGPLEEVTIPPAMAGGAQGVARRAVLTLAAALAAGVGGPWLLRESPDKRRVNALIGQSEQALRAGLPDADGQGAGFLEQAVKLQPDNDEAWGRLALARTYVAEYAPPERAARAVAGAQDAARRALDLNPRQVDALGALAILPPYYGDWQAAEQRMDAVLAVWPGHLPTRDARDFLLSAVGRGRQGSLDRISMAAKDPYHAVYQYKRVYAHWTLGQLDEADRAADRALQLWPRHPAVWFARFNTLALTGRAQRALVYIDDSEARPDLPDWLIDTIRLTAVALASGDRPDIERASLRLVDEVSRSPSQAVSAVTLLCGLGQIDRAFAVANAYLLEQGPLMASVRWRRGQVSLNDERRRKTNMLFLPSSARMRADPRFAVLVERTGLVDYWSAAGVRPDYLA